jgi:hypothetical protein
MTFSQIEVIRAQMILAISQNVPGYLFKGSIREALEYGYERDTNEGILFKQLFRAYEDALDIQVDEHGYII